MSMGMANESVEITEQIHNYLNKIQKIHPNVSLSMLSVEGTLLVAKANNLRSRLLEASENNAEISVTALQMAEALHIEISPLEEVVEAVKRANSTKALMQEMQTTALLEKLRQRKEQL